MNNIENIRNRTILVQTTYQPTPHLETEMELIERLVAQNNKIYWLSCRADFEVCFHNPDHKLKKCNDCQFRVKDGKRIVKQNLSSNEDLYYIEYSDFLTKNDFKKSYVSFNDCNDIIELKKYKYKDYDAGMATASSLVSFTRDHSPNVSEYSDFVKRGLFTGAYLYDTFELILNKINPDLVILFNGRFIENRPLLRLCQKNKIEYATHERGGKLNRFLFRIDSIPHSIETISAEMEMLWENASDDRNAIGKQFYTNRRQRVEDAWYSFTKEQQEGRLPESLKVNKTKKIITIFNSSLDEYEGLEGFGPYFYDNDNNGIKAIAKSLKNEDDIALYLRIHPNLKGLENSQNRFIANEIATIPSVEIIKAEDSVDTYALIEASDIVIVFGSTVGAEAVFAGKKVILLGRGAYENLNCFIIPKSHDELISFLLDKNLKSPVVDKDEILKYGYWNETFGFEYQNYMPIDIANGTYRGMQVRNNSIGKKISRSYKKIKKYFRDK